MQASSLTNGTATSPGSRSLVRTLATASTRLLDLPFRYGLHLLIAARLTIGDVGTFYIVFSIMTIASGFGRLGADRAVTREVASALGRNRPDFARRVIGRGFLTTLLTSGILAGLLGLLAKPIAVYIFHKPSITWFLVLGALSIVPQNIANAAAGALAGLGRVATSQMIYAWLWPCLFCISAVAIPLTVQRSLWIIFGSMVLSAMVGVALLLRALPALPATRAEALSADEPSLLRLGSQLFSVELLQLAVSSAPPLVLGIVASTTEVGRYALAWRIVLLLNLLVSAMAAVATPQFARAWATGDRTTLLRVACQAVGLTTALAIVPLTLLAGMPGFFLGRFGIAYLAAAPALRILLVGQLALILTAAVPEMLGMTNHAKALLKINIGSLAVLLVGLACFTPGKGASGAALATAIAMVVSAGAVSYVARRDLGVVPIFNVFETLAAQWRERFSPSAISAKPAASDVHDIDNS